MQVHFQNWIAFLNNDNYIDPREFHALAEYVFGMNIIFSDPYMPSDEVIKKYNATPCSSVEEVLEKADFVSIHCPGGESTYHLMNKERIGMMKKGAYLINSARGDVIDNDALIEDLSLELIPRNSRDS